MFLPDGYKLKYKHVTFKHWPPKLSHVAFKSYGGYLPTLQGAWLTLCTMHRMTTKKNHPSGLKRWSGKLSTIIKGMFGQKIAKPLFPPIA